jgi:hypothetical protein
LIPEKLIEIINFHLLIVLISSDLERELVVFQPIHIIFVFTLDVEVIELDITSCELVRSLVR